MIYFIYSYFKIEKNVFFFFIESTFKNFTFLSLSKETWKIIYS